MSFEDRIFEVEAALEGKPELEDFNYIIKLFNTIETENEELHRVTNTLKNAIRIVDPTIVRMEVPDET